MGCLSVGLEGNLQKQIIPFHIWRQPGFKMLALYFWLKYMQDKQLVFRFQYCIMQKFWTCERISQAITYLCYTIISCFTGTLLSPVCRSDLVVIEVPIYNLHLYFSNQMCVFLCLQWSLVVATITEIPPLVFLPNFLVQRKVLRPLRTQTGGTIMVGPSENCTHTAEQNDFKTFWFCVMFQCCSSIFSTDVTFLPLVLWVGNVGL